MDAIRITSWNDLEPLGLNVLTGEACAYMLRVLCDVNEDGRQRMLDYFGLPDDTALQLPWNRQVNGQPSVGSIMLHRDSLRGIGEFLLRKAGAKALLHFPSSSGVVGLFTDERVKEYEDLIESLPASTREWSLQRISPSTQPAVGSRNVHAATGRVL